MMQPQTLARILEGRKARPQQLIEVLQDIQQDCGFISREDMKVVSRSLGVPEIEVFRVASFYKAFRLEPAGRVVLTICLGTACHVRSAGLLIDQAAAQLGIEPGEVTPDGLFSIDRVNCLGACAMGPIVKENGKVHHHMTPGKLRRLIETIRAREIGGN